MSPSFVITVLVALAALLFGRQLFWLFVGIVGFLVSFDLATQYLTDQSSLVILIIALLVGLVGAVLAVFLQYVAAAIAGFLAGAYFAFWILRALDAPGSGWLLWSLIIVGGLLGAALILLLFDWALILLSASTGAATLVQLFDLTPAITFLLFFLLLLIGIASQTYQMRRAEYTPVRRIRRVRRAAPE